ncbi:TonB-dependent receptor plug domain-containing protein [Thiohalorhabdus sp.]|uniref:TonB-dependent receptor plug domain-containing protein n=1 Tax=Thiohalorhabdus sp. TaxID=3094134 RepID=UPI002FC34A0A
MSVAPLDITGVAVPDNPLSVPPVPTPALDRGTFQKRPGRRRLGDVINRMPGVFVGGPPGENKDIRLRGLDKEFTRFELDNVQLPGGGEKREFQVNRLSPFAIGEIRIQRQTTALEESDGIAGRVLADLRAIPDDLRTDFRVLGGAASEGDEQGLYGANLAVGDRNERFGGQLFLDLTHNPLHKDKTKRKFEADGSLKEVERQEEDKPNVTANVIGDLAGYYQGGSVHFKPMYLHLDEDKDKLKKKFKADGSLKEREAETEEKIQETLGAKVEHKHTFGPRVSVASEVGYYETTEDKEKIKIKRKGDGSLKEREVEDEDKEDAFWMARSRMTLRYGEQLTNNVSFGFKLRQRDRFKDKTKTKIKPDGSTDDATEGKDNYDIDAEYVAGFAQASHQLTTRWTASAGLRYERVERTGVSGDGRKGSAAFEDFNPNVHLRFQATPELALFASASRSLNRPKFDTLAPFTEEKGGRLVRGNPELEPATSRNLDIGAEWQGTHTRTAVTVFHKEISDVIEEADTGRSVGGKNIFKVQNVGDGDLQGIELEHRLDGVLVADALQGLELWGNASFFDGELTDRSGKTRPFNEQPDSVINAGANYRLASTGTRFSVAYKRIGELEKAKVDEEETEDDRTSVDLSVAQPLSGLGEGWRVTFDALNVTDAEKDKTKRKFEPDGSLKEIERETETTGRVFLLSLEGRF